MGALAVCLIGHCHALPWISDVLPRDPALFDGQSAFCRYYGKEFTLTFALVVEAAGIHHGYIRPRRPQQNWKVERSHRINHEEFWSRHEFGDFIRASEALRRWEHTYNHERSSPTLQGQTPIEKLVAASQPPAAA